MIYSKEKRFKILCGRKTSGWSFKVPEGYNKCFYCKLSFLNMLGHRMEVGEGERTIAFVWLCKTCVTENCRSVTR